MIDKEFNKNNEKENKVICVLGMHRSGTSMVMRLLNICGVFVGRDVELYKSIYDNTKGHFEHLEVIRINDEILNIFNGTYDEPPLFSQNWERDKRLDNLYKEANSFVDKMNQKSDLWGFKDPRTCLTLPFWQKVIPDMKYVIPIRFPMEVAISLHKRNGVNISNGLLLYLTYWNSILKYVKKEDRCFTVFDNYFENWKNELGKVLNCLSINKLTIKNNEEQIKKFISPGLRHNKYNKFFDLEQIDTNKILKLVLDAFTDINVELDKDFYIKEKQISDFKNIIQQKEQEIIKKDIDIQQKEQEIIKKDIDIQQKEQEIIQKDIEIQAKFKQIKMMQSSKFWKFRNIYIHYKNSTKQGIKNPKLVIIFLKKRFNKIIGKENKVVSQNQKNKGNISKEEKNKNKKVHTCNEDCFIGYSNNQEIESRIKAIAFYLPQFHPIPENDKWWGRGFTEWTNVSRATPQFEGHYQPRLPGELGFYDLRLKEVQKQQIELAKNYGIYGFCYHLYWFNGRRLLEKPLQQLLDNPDLDFPFCVNWANENWTRRWDGMDQDVLMEQKYSDEDDIEFIKEISKLFEDERYIRIDGKPLLMLYRASLLPDALATTNRWREYCRNSGIGEIYLVLTQSCDEINPQDVGFDAAVEFAPNRFNLTNISEEVDWKNEKHTKTIYSYDSAIEYSWNRKKPLYKRFRGICPSWDNEARKTGKGTVLAGTCPSKYSTWLKCICEYTDKNFNKQEKLIFINAWNEWGEGAYLEPDKKNGYAYLQKTYNILRQFTDKKKIIFVGHDANKNGAQLLTLNIIRELSDRFKFDIHLIIKNGGALETEYERYATLYNLQKNYESETKVMSLIKVLKKENIFHAITNTTVTGDIAKILSENNIKTISLIHELPEIIKQMNLQDNAENVANFSDKVVFPSDFVKEKFNTISPVNENKCIKQPQGSYKTNKYINSIDYAREELRGRISVPRDAKIILGAGFADYRKGIDIFVSVATEVCKKNEKIYFVWIGDIAQDMQKVVDEAKKKCKNIITLPFQDSVSIFYAGSDLYLLTSREDPFPTVVLEAMMVGVPVIGFKDAGGFRDIVTNNTGVLVSYCDHVAMAKAIEDLLNDEKKYNKLSLNSKQLIEERFVWKDYIYNLLALLGFKFKKVSVIVPNYNYDTYIIDRLDSIINQDYPIYEIIILDDCSKDKSVIKIKSFIEENNLNVVFIENKKNSGSVFKQWAKGIVIAKGEYIWIAEADDLSKKEFLSGVMKAFDENSVVLSYSQSESIDENSEALNKNYLKYVSEIDNDKWKKDYVEDGMKEIANCLSIKNTVPNVSAVVFKKNNINEIVEDLQKFSVAGDWYFYVWLLQKGKIAYCAQALNIHRRHRNSVTVNSKNNVKHYNEIIEMQKKVASISVVSSQKQKLAEQYRNEVRKYLGLDNINY